MNFMNYVTEVKDTQNNAYILEPPAHFYNVGYKVLLGQEKNGFIKCTKISHNGKDKLIYDIAKFKTLEVLLPTLDFHMLLEILLQFLDALILTKSNGFMQCENILVSPDQIFIDGDEYLVNLIYLPVYHESDAESYSLFEKELKSMLVFVLSIYMEQDSFIAIICEGMRHTDFTLEDTRKILDYLVKNNYEEIQNFMLEKNKDNNMFKPQSSDRFDNVKKLFSFTKKSKN